MQETGNGFWISVYAVTGTLLADLTGVLSIDNAIQGEDCYTGRKLSGTERFLEGVSGGIQLISTAFGGLNMVRSTIRATGGCQTALGKVFTNCCFTEDVEVLMYHEPITVSNDAVCADKIEVHYFTEKNNYLPYIITLAAGTLGVNAYISGRKRRNRNTIEACYEMFGTDEENNFADTNDIENEQFLRSLIELRENEMQTNQIIADEEMIVHDEMSDIPEPGLENKHFTNRKDNQRKEKTNWRSSILQYGGLLTILISFFVLISLVQRDSGSNVNSSLPQTQAAVAPVVPTEPPKPEIYRKKISDIHIGEKSVGHNPQGIEASEADSEIFQKVKHNGFTLLYLKENQTLSVIELLRPANWLESENVQIRRASDDKVLTEEELNKLETAKAFEKDDDDYDLEVWIELPEMGVAGWATLVAINGEVNIQDGPGNVVTGTFAHISDNVIDLQLEGQDKSIGCTGNHPFWSVDRQEFIEAGQLLEGEQVLLYNGETKRVVQKLPRPGPQVVYNLEVYAEHVYHVTQDGVLVHNACNSKILAKNMKRAGIYNPKTGNIRFAAHHIVCAKDTPEAAKILKQYKIDINSFWNGVYLPMKKNTSFGTAHIGRHSQAYKEYINSVFTNSKFSNRGEVLKALQKIRNQLASGNLPLN